MECSNEDSQSSFLQDNYSLVRVKDGDEEDSESIPSIGDFEPEVIIGEETGDAKEDNSSEVDEAWSHLDFEPQVLLSQELTEPISNGLQCVDTAKTKKRIKKEKVECPNCTKTCTNLKTHKCKTGITFPCDVCGKHLATQSSLAKHKTLHLADKFICEICSKPHTTMNAYLVHQEQHLNLKPFPCHICDRKFGKKQLLDEHLKVHLDIRPFVCEVCNKSFVRKSHLDFHKEGHFPQYKCELCDRVFTRKGQLQEHVRSHTGERPFKCEECGKEYARKTRLKYHKCGAVEVVPLPKPIKQIEPGENPRFVCDICNKRLLTVEDLEVHRESHNLRFKCEVCSRLFTRKAQLVEHERTHTGDKPFKCESCGKDYTRKIRLKRHSCKPVQATKKLKTEGNKISPDFVFIQ